MNKLVIKALAPVIQRTIDETGNLIFQQLLTCVNNGIDINKALNDTDDYNIFWGNIKKFNEDIKSIEE